MQPIMTPRDCPLRRKGCGGCQYAEIPYPQQLARKQAHARKLLAEWGPVEPVLGMEDPCRYRCKVTASFAEDGRRRLVCGLYAKGSRRVLPADGCPLQDELAEQAVHAVLQAARECRYTVYDPMRRTGLVRHIQIRRGLYTGQLMVTLVTGPDILPGSRRFAARVRELCPDVTTLVQNLNPRPTSMVLGDKCRTLFGPGFIEDTLCGLRFRISPASFYQVNPRQTQRLYELAIREAGLTGRETVLDAYCGTGTIGLAAAGKAAQVLGVELNAAAVRDAQANARHNHIQNARFVCADAGEYMNRLAEEHAAPDVVFMDPPRSGSTPEFLAALGRLAPSRVVYISCDPSTQARDIALLVREGYRMVRATPVDMFPYTEHLETVVLLSKGEIDSKKVRVEFSLEDMDMSGFQKGATYEQIKAYVLEHTGLKVSSLYISQIKRKCGLDVGQNYNLSKKEDAKVPQCPPEKEAAIMEALKYFQMI